MPSRKVLVIEDNVPNMELAVDLLEVAGFEVLQATDAQEGIALAREEQPDVIVMDVGLPGMDGLEATAALKRDPATQHIPILVATSHAMKGNKEGAIAAGCDGFITKPIDTRSFAKAVAGLVRAKEGAAE